MITPCPCARCPVSGRRRWTAARLGVVTVADPAISREPVRVGQAADPARGTGVRQGRSRGAGGPRSESISSEDTFATDLTDRTESLR